jgi:transposase-like protein
MNQLTLSECSKRKLDETYLVVYAIKNEINIKKGDYIEKSNVYTLIGIDLKGFRQFLNVYQDRVNNNRFWLDCFESLKSRGLKNILFLSVDDNRNMKRTAKIAFPEIIFVDSLTDIIPKFYKYSPEKDARKLASKLHSLYTQKTLTECQNEFKSFKEIYSNAIQQKLIQKYLSNVENLYKYSQNIRILLFKHSANMEFYDKIRLSFNSNNNYILEIDEIYTKLGNLKEHFGFTSFKKKEWTFILNDLIQIYTKMDFI